MNITRRRALRGMTAAAIASPLGIGVSIAAAAETDAPLLAMIEEAGAIFEGNHHDVSGDIGKPADASLARCDDCQAKWPVSALKEPRRLEERMDHPPGHPDRIEPAGECPACGALAYAI